MRLSIAGPRHTESLTLMPPATVEVSFNALFGPAAAITRQDGLTIRLGDRTIELRLPFTETAEGVRANLR